MIDGMQSISRHLSKDQSILKEPFIVFTHIQGSNGTGMQSRRTSLCSHIRHPFLETECEGSRQLRSIIKINSAPPRDATNRFRQLRSRISRAHQKALCDFLEHRRIIEASDFEWALACETAPRKYCIRFNHLPAILYYSLTRCLSIRTGVIYVYGPARARLWCATRITIYKYVMHI